MGSPTEDRSADLKKPLTALSEKVQEMSFLNTYEVLENTHDMVTGKTQSPNPVPEFLTAHIPSRTVLSQPNCDHKDFLMRHYPLQNNTLQRPHKTQFTD